jgi:DNA-directed DNA polymerase III PolC
MSQGCAHLHVHSEYSLLDGAAKIDKLAERAAAFGQPALALTDHGVMNGAVELYQAAKKHGIKPIQGCEVYVTDDHTKRGKRHHLTLIAENAAGYRNLVKLCSSGFLEGLQRGKPTVDAGLMGTYSEGIIALTGCLASRFCQALVGDREAEARAVADELLQIYGHENVFFEVQKNGIAEQEKANAGIVKIARELGRPLVGTGDVHYLRREDYDNHTALLCVQTKSTLAAPKMTFDTNEFYLRSSDEMADKFAEWPEALATTLEIAERCDVEIELGKQLIPRFECPGGMVESEYLRQLVMEGLAWRFGDPIPAAALERAEYELGVIDRMGYSGYFLIVWDFIKWARDHGIPVGPGRGSAAGSLVAYSTRITDLDPLAYDLLFERFLNPERVSMPDIDIDFSVRGREQVIQYVTEKYGKDSVAQIITFGKMFPRAATRDAARVLGFPYALGDKLAKLIPDPEQGRAPKFEDCLAPGQPLAAEVQSNADSHRIVEVARGLEGIVRNASIHAAAVVIAPQPLTDLVPVQLADTNKSDEAGDKIYRTVTQFSMKPVEAMGLLKMDFLGLRNLDVIEDALDIIERSSGARPDMTALRLDDEKTYKMLSRGESIGVFQFESEGFREALKRVRPTEFDDLVALGALYRPGAMDSIPAYARGKHDPDTIDFHDERLRPILASTKGVIIYQEQAMVISRELAGFSGAKADDLRKAIGKKNREAMAKLKPEFVEGCRASGTAESVIDWIWTTNEKSADYSFNKCASGQTRVILPDGKRVRLSQAYKLQPDEIMSMWADGAIRPHKVSKIVQTGRKQVYRVRCESGRQIRVTAEHRLLTTAGYQPVSAMVVGDTELITTPMISDKQREARRETMTKLAHRPERVEWDRQASVRMRAYQRSRPPEDLVAHMKRMHTLHPDLTRNGVAATHERVKWLWANDPDWRAKQVERSFAKVRAAYDTGPGYRHCSIASNGMWCASWPERQMCEWLIDMGIEFEMHKSLASGRMCDFYFDGVYWEMDGMDRTDDYFAAKYGELPYVVVTPEDFRFRVERHLATAHAENGDLIVAIEPLGVEMTYDVEMSADGPLNFIGNGIVSHNSHAACYALISYRTAWLRANYPAEYMAALISSVMDTKDKVPFFVAQAEQMGIGILPPDVNLSDHRFVVVEGNIRFGLDAVKGVGYAAVEAIKRAREDGDFTDIFDFCERVDGRSVNKKAIEALIKCGAFGSTGATRLGMLAVLETAQAAGQKAQQDLAVGQGSIFDLGLDLGGGAGAAGSSTRPSHAPIPPGEFEQNELLAMEKESIGLYISEHPLKTLSLAMSTKTDVNLGSVGECKDGERVTIGGMISQVKRLRTKKGDPMVFATLEDLSGSVELVIFADTLDESGGAVEHDAVVLVKGKVDHKDASRTCVVASSVERFEPSDDEIARAEEEASRVVVPATLQLRLDAGAVQADLFEDLREVLASFPGESVVVVELSSARGCRRVRLGAEFRVQRTAGLYAELAQLLGSALLPAESTAAAA